MLDLEASKLCAFFFNPHLGLMDQGCQLSFFFSCFSISLKSLRNMFIQLNEQSLSHYHTTTFHVLLFRLSIWGDVYSHFVALPRLKRITRPLAHMISTNVIISIPRN
eukprot:TRINITY_DN19678_c0_g1_i1.p1 TRINITY_DN19678_c0_g1~~TRINITY_DN19678_c0_g1_i1.p1  ORF type:complete len:107 (+),score=3.49 TRINITY_DN19678_c0_g1_i1:68-388(+)